MNDTPNYNYKELAKNCKTIKDVNDTIKDMVKNVVEQILQAELDEHLAYKKYQRKDDDASGGLHPTQPLNSRNGKSEKTLRSNFGPIEINVPRDRKSEFNPQIIKKHQKDISDFDEKIISMYAKGMTTRDIQDHVLEVYGTEISPTMVSMITDKVETLVIEWQNKPLESIYSVIYFDAIHYKVRDNGKIISKAAYTVLGINLEGKKEILGIWIGENEGAKFWAAVLNELRSRGVKDILISCIDGLRGLPEAIKSIFPETEIQLCIVHMIRNSLKFVGSKFQKEFLKDLKMIYQASSLEAASAALDILISKWGKQYPLAVNPWINNWDKVSNFFKYPHELRRIIYTTNAVEAVHRQFRKVTKNRSVMPNDNALLKLLFLASRDIQKKWMVTQNWGIIISQLHLIFGDRIMMD